MRSTACVLLLLLLGLSSAFSIDDYRDEVTVNEDGSILVYERMTFELEEAYNEGFRSIRAEDFGTLSDIIVNDVKVNGESVASAKQMNQGMAEIVWKKTYVGTNVVELNYTIADRVQLYNDFAKVCFEHYGANWPVPAGKFSARTTLPPGSAGKTMHFEVYSSKQGKAYVDNLSIVIEMDNVPSGNYVGGCYLFDRGAVQTNSTVDAAAYAILKEEREAYGSKSVLEAQEPALEWCCVPLFLLSALVAASIFMKERKRPRLPESILPPGKEEPAVVSALVRNRVDTKEMLAATVVDLIDRGVIDIIELEKKDAKVAKEISRERTVLFLKKQPPDLKDYEKSVLSLIFADGKEVDLDAKMEEFKGISSQAEAKKMKVVSALDDFRSGFPRQIEDSFKDSEIKELKDATATRLPAMIGMVFMFGILVMFLASLSGGSVSTDSIGWYIQHGELLRLGAIVVSAIGFIITASYSVNTYLKAVVPKSRKNRELYAKWEAFYRGLKASRIKEHPPSSAVIWGRILVYATALGLADKVRRHLSELDSALAAKVERMDGVALASMSYYSGAISVRNLAKFGNRAGVSGSGGRHGGFSSYSSGGWSSGGGGFSGGSSGGGGFR